MGNLASVNSHAYVNLRSAGASGTPTADMRQNGSGSNPGSNALTSSLQAELDLLDQSLEVNIKLTEGARNALDQAEKAARMAKRFSMDNMFSHLHRRFVRDLKAAFGPMAQEADDFDRNAVRIANQLSEATALRAAEGASRLSVESLSVSVSVERMDIAISQGNRTTTVSLQRVEIRIDYFAAEITQDEPVMQDPLVFDMDGDGIETVPLEQGVLFDLDADGRAENTAWIGADDAFLAYDRNGNGRIDHGGELFGDQNGARDGIAELAKFDDDKNGIIDSRDAIFNSLQLAFGNGRVEALADWGIVRINLSQADYHDREITGGREVARFGFDYADGRRGTGADILLETTA